MAGPKSKTWNTFVDEYSFTQRIRSSKVADNIIEMEKQLDIDILDDPADSVDFRVAPPIDYIIEQLNLFTVVCTTKWIWPGKNEKLM